MMTMTYRDEVLTIEAGGFRKEIEAKQVAGHWYALSQFPESTARAELQSLAGRLAGFREFLDDLARRGGAVDAAAEAEAFTRRHVELTQAYWRASAKCASAWVVGPAHFSTHRNEQRLAAQDRAQAAVWEHERTAREAVERRAFPHSSPAGPVRGDAEAIEALRGQIEAARAMQETMRAVNVIIREHKAAPERCIAEIAKATGWDAQECGKLLRPDPVGRIGFPNYRLQNNIAKIRRLERKVASLERKKEQAR